MNDDSNEASTALLRGADYTDYRAAFEAKKRQRATAAASLAGPVLDALPWLYMSAGRHMDRGLALLKCAHDDSAPLPIDGDASVASTQRSPQRRSPHREITSSAAYRLLAARRSPVSVIVKATKARELPLSMSPIPADDEYVYAEESRLIPGDMQPQSMPPASDDCRMGSETAAAATADPDVEESPLQPPMTMMAVVPRLAVDALHPEHRHLHELREAARQRARDEQRRHMQYGLPLNAKGELVVLSPQRNQSPPRRLPQLKPLPTPAQLKAKHKAESSAASGPVANLAADPSVGIVEETSRRLAKASSMPSRYDVSHAIATARAHFSGAQLRILNDQTAEAFHGGPKGPGRGAKGSQDVLRSFHQYNQSVDERLAARAVSAVCTAAAAVAVTHTNQYAAQELNRCFALGAPDTLRIVSHGRVESPVTNGLHVMATLMPRRQGALCAIAQMDGHTNLTPSTSWLVCRAPSDDGAAGRYYVAVACSDALMPANNADASQPRPAPSYYPIDIGKPRPLAPEVYAQRCNNFSRRAYASFVEELMRLRLAAHEQMERLTITASYRLNHRPATRPNRFCLRRAHTITRCEMTSRTAIVRQHAVGLVHDGHILDLVSGAVLTSARRAVSDIFCLGAIEEKVATVRTTCFAAWVNFARGRRAAAAAEASTLLLMRRKWAVWSELARRNALSKDAVRSRASTDSSVLRVERWAWSRANAVAADVVGCLSQVCAVDESSITLCGHDRGGAVAAALALKLIADRAELGRGHLEDVVMLAAPPVLHPADPPLDAVTQAANVTTLHIALADDPTLSYWAGFDGYVLTPERRQLLVSAHRHPLTPVRPAWCRSLWAQHYPDSILHKLLHVAGGAGGNRSGRVTVEEPPEDDAEASAFEYLAWDAASKTFIPSVRAALDAIFARLSVGSVGSGIEHAVLGATLNRAAAPAPIQWLLQNAKRLDDVNRHGTDAQCVTHRGFIRFAEFLFLHVSPAFLLDVLDLFGYYTGERALQNDASLVDDLALHRPGTGPWPGYIARARLKDELPPPLRVPFNAAATAALLDVFSHYSRASNTSPFAGTGLGLTAATPECIVSLLRAGRWAEMTMEPPMPFVIRLWAEIEKRHIAMRPFATLSSGKAMASMLMTFEGGMTATGFLAFMTLMIEERGSEFVCIMLYTLGFNHHLQHAITRGTLDNVHRRDAPTCGCTVHERANARLLAAEETCFRSWVEDHLQDLQQQKLIAVESQSKQLVERSRSMGGSMLRSTPSWRPAALDPAPSSATKTKPLANITAPPKAATPEPSFAAREGDPRLSPTVRGRGPLAAPLKPLRRVPSPEGGEAKSRRARRRQGDPNAEVRFKPRQHLVQSTNIYRANHGISTFNPLQRHVLNMGTK
jgi:hypothetical protein